MLSNYNYKEINQQYEKFSYLRDEKSSILQQNYPACTRRNTLKLLPRPAKQYFQRYDQVIVEIKQKYNIYLKDNGLIDTYTFYYARCFKTNNERECRMTLLPTI